MAEPAITAARREEFDQRGVVRIEGLIPEAIVAPARDLVIGIFERHGAWADGRWTGPTGDGQLANPVRGALKQAIKDCPAFTALATPEVLAVVAQLVDGRAISTEMNQAQLLTTLPNAREWTVPHKIWHLDVPRLGAVGLPGVQMFTFLNEVAPGGGGTLVVAGSHLLLNDRGRIRSKDVKRVLKKEPYFRRLMTPQDDDRRLFLEEPGHLGDVELQVVEFTGRPGDVYLTDLRLLHTLAPNTSTEPRLMVTRRFFLDALIADLYEPPDRRGR